MNLTFNNITVGGIEQGGSVHYNLYEIARVLGYAQPRTAVRNFTERSKVFQRFPPNWRADLEKASEQVLFAFLIYSDAPRAVDFQFYICNIVLPLVRQVGVKAIQEIAVMKALRANYNIGVEELYALAPEEVVNAVLDEEGWYNHLGMFPPSHFGSPKKIAEILIEYGVFDEEGNPKPEFAESVKYSGKYTQRGWGHVVGKWYAYKPELVEAATKAYNEKQSTKIFFSQAINDLELI